MPIQISLSNAIGALQGLAGGGPGPSPFTGFLDTAYGSGAIAAFSVRRLSSSTTVVLRVIRDTNGGGGHHDLIDVSFDPNDNISLDSPVSNPSSPSDATNLGEFFGNPAYGNPDNLPATFITGAVHTWYDQAGTNHAVQTDYLRQPRIYSGSLSGGALTLTGTRLRLARANSRTSFELSTTLTDSDLDIFTVSNPVSTSAFLSSDPNDVLLISQDGDSSNHTARMGTPSLYLQGNSFTGTTRSELYSALGGDMQNIVDAFNVDVSDAIYTRLGWPEVGVPAWEMQEVIFYNTDKTGVRQQIEEDFNDYYQVTNLPYYSSGFLADYTGAAAAYSVRKLSNTAIKCMRVRRAVPPYDEQDIGFTAGGDLDETAIVAFGGSDVLNVSAWYDQSGQSNHATQIAPNSQPQIYDGAAVITENGKPCVHSAVSTGHMVFNNTGWNINNLACFFAGVNTSSASRPPVTLGAFTDGAAWYQNWSNLVYYGTGTVSGASITRGSQTLTALIASTSQSTVYVRQDGAANASRSTINATVGSTSVGLGHLGGGFTDAGNKWQEVIVWTNDQYANISGIETSIIDYYKIIVNDEAATSGFLFDYPNAAVAYSVRQLNNNAEFAMQVERSDGRTKNIGFDGNGDLDTQAIIDFSGASVATISAWYDQTGNQNHSRQSNPIRQPEIYNGTAINTDNGKPSLLFTDPGQDSNTDVLTWHSNVDTQLFTWSTVAGFAPPGATRTIIHMGNTGVSNYLRVNANGYTIVKPNDFDFLNGSTFDGTQKQNTIVRSSATTATSYQNNSQTGTISTLDASNILWANTDANITGSGILSFNVQEIVLWKSDQDSAGNRSNIDTDMKTYFSIT